MRISTFFDQSLYVRASIQGYPEAIILPASRRHDSVFLGNWKTPDHCRLDSFVYSRQHPLS